MVRKIKWILCLALIAFAFTGVQALAETNTVELSADNTTVRNELPEIMIYCETTQAYQTDVSVDIDGYPAQVLSAKAFRDRGEGITYYMLVDVSSSIRKKDFGRIQDALVDFSENIAGEKDRLMLIPFGERVYYSEGQEFYPPGSEDFNAEVRYMEAVDRYTNLYDAIDTVAGIIENEDADRIERNAVLVFTDGMDDTTGGYKNEKEAPEALRSLGTPLYAFTVGKSKKDKDKLGVLARSLNGRIYMGDVSSGLRQLKNSLDNTLTIEAEANNAAAVGASFDTTVTIAGQSKAIVKKGIPASRTGDEKNSLGYTLKTLFASYWWILAILAIALIALIVLLVIRRHKGIIRVDGETVFRDNVTSKARINVSRKEIVKLTMVISVDGSNEVVRDVDLVSSLIVGRSNACDLSIDDPAMARQNFCIEFHEGRLFLRDLDSTNGTILNGIRLTAPQELHRGDVIVAGKSRMAVRW